jgi:hypothetical protein
LPEFGPL